MRVVRLQRGTRTHDVGANFTYVELEINQAIEALTPVLRNN